MRVLVLIDVQRGLDEAAYYGGARNNPACEANIARLLAAARAAGAPVFHVKHNSSEADSPLRPGAPGNAFKREAEPHPGELVFEKTVNSAFIGTELEAQLREAGLRELVMAGLTTEHCVSTSVRMAANLGFEVRLVADACAAYPKTDAAGRHWSAEDVHALHLASLDGEFAQLITADDAIAEFSRSAIAETAP